MVPNPVVLPSTNANMNHLNGQLQANSNANKMDKESSYVTAQMSNLSLGHSMNAADINDGLYIFNKQQQQKMKH